MNETDYPLEGPISLSEIAHEVHQKVVEKLKDAELEAQHMQFYAMMLIMMFFFFAAAAYNDKYKPSCGHQTSYTLIIGCLVSVGLWYAYHDSRAQMYKFKADIFFDFMLPPLMLNSGYNMRRKKFFQNLGNVAIFGLGVTFTCFVIFSVLTYLSLIYGDMYMTNYYEGGTMPIEIDVMKMLLFTSLLCSSDVVAAVSIVNYEAQPKLFSCIFGEGVVNDIVSIILFNTIESLQGTEFTWYSPFTIAGQFLLLGFISVGMGLLFGVILALMLKHLRFLTVTPIIETFMVFSFSYAVYFLTNLIRLPSGLEMSGIIALLVCGIFSAHYTYYNLSPQGRVATTLSFSFAGEVAEAAVYSYVGLALYSSIPTWWSVSFVLVQLAIIIGGRIVGVLSTFYCCRLMCRTKTIKFNELLFITYGGMIRGAIAFALVLKIEFKGDEGNEECEDCYTKENYELAVSSCLMLVLATTLMFGTFMDIVQKFLTPSTKISEHGSQHSHQMDGHSSYEEILHPNEEKSIISDSKPAYDGPAPWSFLTSSFVKWFLENDEKVFRPFLIRNYSAHDMMLLDQQEDSHANKHVDHAVEGLLDQDFLHGPEIVEMAQGGVQYSSNPGRSTHTGLGSTGAGAAPMFDEIEEVPSFGLNNSSHHKAHK